MNVDTGHRIQSFRPLEAFGSTVDKEPAGSMRRLFSAQNVREMLDAGLGWLSYRLYSELSAQDWHWNPRGSFSAGSSGYWTSSSAAGPQITDSYEYALPMRGFTPDQGDNAGYSRLDDGNPHTYWKSNPYLTQRYTHESDTLHAQWVVLDLESARRVDAVRISWAHPYAREYSVQYWSGTDPIGDPGKGRWMSFPRGQVTGGHGGVVLLSLGAAGPVRFVRIVMTASSNTCDTHGNADPRNCVGYAIDEVSLGVMRGAHFEDYVHHVPCGGEKPGRYACGRRQTATYVSSVDPWHRATDRVLNQEQPGLDLIARSGLTHGMGAMYPVAMLYSTPENAVAEIRYLRARRYPVARVELGEEPDGQYTTPEDFAALYVQWARALHAVDPSLQLGGPVFSGANSDIQAWPDSHGDVSWLHRFLGYLRAHQSMADLAFMSFEHYPFDGCEHGAKLTADLVKEPALMKAVVDAWRKDGVPASVPMVITEANFSAVNFSEVPMRIEGALWLADYFAGALTNGVSAVVYYQYEPVPLSQNRGCKSDWGNLTMFVGDRRGNIRGRAAQFFAAKMLTQEWVQPGRKEHELFAATLAPAVPKLTAYALKRPDGRWSIMLVNKGAAPLPVSVEFGSQRFTGNIERVTFGSAQYFWKRDGGNSRGVSAGIVRTTAAASATYVVPAQSITILRGRIAQLSGAP
ncbi:MAG: hypothetical protein NVS9B12_02380 [Vulcanimicrobiaceae bacterium]